MSVTHYTNPILRGMYPDPSIVKVDQTYYMVNSTFEYFPGISLSKSTDLLNWTKLPSIIQEKSQANLDEAQSNEGIFAVCIRYINDTFYVITTNFAEFKNFIIAGKLSPDGQSINWNTTRTELDIMGIDPDLYVEDNRTYVQFTGYIDDKGTKAIQQVEIELESGNILRGPEVISFGTGGRDVEGPHILKQKGYYYLLAAEGGTGIGHMITIFRSKSLWGPYESAPTNPIFTNRDRANQPLQNIGHADLFQDCHQNWWLTCLGTRPATVGFVNFTNIGRETLLYPVNWTDDWPVIYNGIPEEIVSLENFSKHAKVLGEQKIEPFIDNFESEQLNPEWVTLRKGLNKRLTLSKNQLTLLGSPFSLSDIATPSFLAVRQTEHQEVFHIEISDDSNYQNGSIGIACMINNTHHAAILVSQNATGHYDVFKTVTVLDLKVNEKIGTLEQKPINFSLTNTADAKIFKVSNHNEAVEYSIHAMHFSNEAIAALNTGDMQGIYVLGEAKAIVTKAMRETIKK
ncbi:family 43 glycosylhydrolase [Tuanshanicoccus lijuaniae]|uniref:family 43 glycosylhydrolase n=1 Tax=Aerococcaceae bacterium zg-1292 TaxID=2774330 RepID=UPI001BD8C83B|nr:family 43 glycosylhydrolase [Aerococcaceae bacterium zg-A91]MBS4457319.1 family 43 glycosylhydrolase [Aerococcaceae bacterium zg-BR33]